MFFTSSDGLRLYYETHGDPSGSPVVLLHGIGADHAMFQPQIVPFAAAGLYVIVPDVRGHGQSDPALPFRVADCARDVAELLDHLDVARADLAGVSMGGLIVQQCAVDHPQRVGKIVIDDSYSSTGTWVRRLSGWTASLLFRVMPRSLLAKTIEATYNKPGQAAARDYLAGLLRAMPRQQIIASRDAINFFEIAADLPGVTAPALVLVGDGFGGMAVSMAKEAADLIPGARFVVLPGGADPSNMIVPDLFNTHVLAFLAE